MFVTNLSLLQAAIAAMMLVAAVSTAHSLKTASHNSAHHNSIDEEGVSPPPPYPPQSSPYFPQYHVRPPTNWINDPNGPYRDPGTGYIHLWMQYNPEGTVWGNMNWYHMVSTDDFMTWAPLGISLRNDMWYDIGGAFSGSISWKGGSLQAPQLFYTCVDKDTNQRQCVAYPEAGDSNPMLNKWVKSKSNPVIDTFPGQDGGTFFRDPSTALILNNTYNVVFGGSIAASSPSSVVNRTGVLPVYTSSSSSSSFDGAWGFSHFLYEDSFLLTGMFECPDFIDLGDGLYFLKYSSMSTRSDFYRVGHLSSENKFIPLQGSSDIPLDFGTMYASKTYYDPILQKHVLWGWMDEDGGPAASEGWSGLQTLPRALTYIPAIDRVLSFPVAPILNLHNGSLFESTSMVRIAQSSSSSPTLKKIQFKDPSSQYHLSVEASITNTNNIPWNITIAVRQGGVQVVLSANQKELRLNNTQTLGGDYWSEPLPPTHSDEDNANACNALCEKSLKCIAWVFARPAAAVGPMCNLKNTYTSNMPYTGNTSCCVSGSPAGSYLNIVRPDTDGNHRYGLRSMRATLHPTTTKFDIFVDHSVVEVFKDNGAEVGTVRTYPQDTLDGGFDVQVLGGTASTLSYSGNQMRSHWKR